MVFIENRKCGVLFWPSRSLGDHAERGDRSMRAKPVADVCVLYGMRIWNERGLILRVNAAMPMAMKKDWNF